MKNVLGLFLLLPLFCSAFEQTPKVERVIGFTPYFKIFQHFMEKKTRNFACKEALVFADLIKLIVPKNIVVLGDSEEMYPFMSAYFLRYFGQGKVYHYSLLEQKKESYLQKKMESFLDRFHLSYFYEHTNTSKEIPQKIDILVIAFEAHTEKLQALLERFRVGIKKDTIIWVRNKENGIEKSTIPMVRFSIDLLDEDSLVKVYKPSF